MGRTACTEPQCLYSRAIPPLPLWAVRPVQSPSVCTRVHFTLHFLRLSKIFGEYRPEISSLCNFLQSSANSYPLGTNIFLSTTCSNTFSLRSFLTYCSHSNQLHAMSFPTYNFAHPPCCSIELRKCRANRSNRSEVPRRLDSLFSIDGGRGRGGKKKLASLTGLFHATRFAET
jgi:hypothetical protein